MGTPSLFRVTADGGGALERDGHFSLRVPALFSRRDDAQRFVSAQRFFVGPSATWSPTPSTTLTLLAVYQDDRYDRTTPLPVAGTLQPSSAGPVPRDTFLGEPRLTRLLSPQWQIGYLFEHRFGDVLRFCSKLRLVRYGVRGPILSVNQDGSTDDSVVRSGFDCDVDTHSLSLDNQLEGAVTTGPLQHTVLLGVDHLRYRSTSVGASFDLAPISPVQFIYGAKPGPRTPLFSSQAELDETGLYARYRGKLWGWLIGLVGVRSAHVDNVSVDRLRDARTDQPDAKTTFDAAAMALGPLGGRPDLPSPPRRSSIWEWPTHSIACASGST